MSSDKAWSAATWEGSRREQIRRSLCLTVRERLEALEAMSELSERLSRSEVRPRPKSAAGSNREAPSS